jgi:DNA-binding beta-propeller fold protein YncE
MSVRSAQFAMASVVAAIQLVACAGSSGPPHSKLVDLTLPAGSTPRPYQGRGQPSPDQESWDLHRPYADAIATMSKRLPLHHDFEGVPWCDEYQEPGDTAWLWQKADDKIEIDISGSRIGSGVTISHVVGDQHKCVPYPHPGPPQLSTAGNATGIGLWFEPTELTFSTGSNKLYVTDLSGKPATYVLSLSALTNTPQRLDSSITDDGAIAVNNKLKLGYTLNETGSTLRVFNTDTDKLVSTTELRPCQPQVIAVDEATGTVYGGGLSAAGGCLVKLDSAGRIVGEKDVASAGGMIQRIAADPASGDVIYMDPYGVGRADQTLMEKWRAPAPGVSRSSNTGSGLDASDMGYESSSDTVYVCVSPTSRAAPATIAIFDGRTGKQTGQFTSPGSSDQFAGDREGRLFVALNNSRDVYVLDHGAQSLTKFQTLPDVSDKFSRNVEWLAVDPAGHQLFVSPGSGNSVYKYPY